LNSPANSSKPPVSILIIDDDPGLLRMFAGLLAQPGVEIITSDLPEEALAIFAAKRPQIVLTDMNMPGLNGLEVLDRIMAIHPATDVIVVTGDDFSETAIEAMSRGASGYITKPVSADALCDAVGKLVREATLRNGRGESDGDTSVTDFHGIIGRSQSMRTLFSRMRNIAPHYQTLLITGETGTGKELVARAMHDMSPASSGRYVVLNCSAVVESLFESELFGHAKGSFTGAHCDKPGLVEHAHRGTLFLDEIGDMPLATQAKLLRVLQNREVQRVGAMTPYKVDVRVIAATNRDLRADVAARRFREDLFYRLSMIEVRVPRLVDRREDLPLLERHFIGRYAVQYDKRLSGLTPRAKACLAQHAWHGNVRELENVLGHAAMMTRSDVIDLEDFPQYLLEHEEGFPRKSLREAVPGDGDALQQHERLLVVQALERAEGNQSEAARILHIGRDALRYKVQKYGITVLGSEKAAAAAGA
jgi:DNA-binding NtrC family response regulator